MKLLHALARSTETLAQEVACRINREAQQLQVTWAHAHEAPRFGDLGVMLVPGKKNMLRLMVAFERSHVWMCEHGGHLGFHCFLTLIRCADENAAGTRLQVDGAACRHVSCSREVREWELVVVVVVASCRALKHPESNCRTLAHLQYVFPGQNKSDLPK